jgi:hypothetical protein
MRLSGKTLSQLEVLTIAGGDHQQIGGRLCDHGFAQLLNVRRGRIGFTSLVLIEAVRRFCDLEPALTAERQTDSPTLKASHQG